MEIGKIVKSSSHIEYVCQVYGPREVEQVPAPADYAFGRFVRIAVRSAQHGDHNEWITCAQGRSAEPQTYAVGVIYDTILVNPEYGQFSPRLSNDAQVELFSPDYLSEKAVLISVMLLGMYVLYAAETGQSEVLSVTHGVPLLSLETGSILEDMSDEEVRTFHYLSDTRGASALPTLHMGYIPHLIAQRNSLLPLVALQIIDQLERLFPLEKALLSIVQRNFAWRLKVETTG
jgi:hypothetical protein